MSAPQAADQRIAQFREGADQDVIEVVPGQMAAIANIGVHEAQVLDVRQRDQAEARLAREDRVDAFAGIFDNRYPCREARHAVDIVTGPSRHGAIVAHAEVVVTARAVQNVVATGSDHIVEIVPGQRLCGGRIGAHPLDIGGERIGGQRHEDDVVAAAGILDDGISYLVDAESIVAEATDHRVRVQPAVQTIVPSAPVERVDAIGAENDIAQAIAGERLPRIGGAGQILHLGRQRIGGQARADDVGPLAGRLDDRVAGIVDRVIVIAQAADHGVGARRAVERVVAAAGGNDVAQGIARQGLGGAEPGEILDIYEGGEAVNRAIGPDLVGALAGILVDHVARGIDEINVVADPAGHDVVASAAVEAVIADPAVQRVGVVAAVQRVVAVEAVQRVVPAEAVQRVVSTRAVQRVRPARAIHRDLSRSRRNACTRRIGQ